MENESLQLNNLYSDTKFIANRKIKTLQKIIHILSISCLILIIILTININLNYKHEK